MPHNYKERDFPHAQLGFDLKNPRAAGEEFETEDDVVKYLTERSDVNELVSSIMSTGWIDFEPLIVQEDSHVVLEGNRRLAALRLITDEALRGRMGFVLPTIQNPQKPPTEIKIFEVAGREEARSFIAFKHINGPAKWDAMAKAKYAEEWYSQQNDLSRVSKAIGDTHNTVLRLINGWRVYQQSLKLGFDPKEITARRFNFSHLYTALTRPSVRRFLGLSEDLSAVLDADPVKEGSDQLLLLLKWIYGQESSNSQHLVKSQNPDLGRLVRVIGNDKALAHLTATGDLKAANDIVEPASQRFAESLSLTSVAAERTLGLVSHYERSEQGDLTAIIRAVANTEKGDVPNLFAWIGHVGFSDVLRLGA